MNDHFHQPSTCTLVLKSNTVIIQSPKPTTTMKQTKPRSNLLHDKLPNRPMPAFNIFFQQQRDRILGEYKGSSSAQPSYSDILQTLTIKWRSFAHQERLVYSKLANQEKVRFANELVVWNRKQDLHNKDLKKMARKAKRSCRKRQQ